MLKRTITGALMIIIFIPLLILSGWYYTILVALLSYIGGYEIIKAMASKEQGFKYLKYVAPLWNVVTIIIAHFVPEALLLTMVFAFICFITICIIHPHYSMKQSIYLFFSYFYTGVLASSLLTLRLPFSDGYFNLGFYRFLYLLTITISTDAGAYLIGRLIGKRKLCPSISPNKTIAGAIGGLIFGTILGVTAYFIFSRLLDMNQLLILNNINIGLEIIVVVLISLVLSVFAQIGDLIASKFKRAYDIKDYGIIFPGHGGVMDRFDSLLIAGSMLSFIITFISI